MANLRTQRTFNTGKSKMAANAGNGFSLSEKIADYNYHRQALAYFSRLPQMEMREIHKENYRDVLRDTPISAEQVSKLLQSETDVTGIEGKRRHLRITKVEFTPEKASAPSTSPQESWIVEIDKGTGIRPYYGQKAIITRSRSGHQTRTSTDINISDEITPQDHQTHAVVAIASAAARHVKEMPLVYATGTGKTFILLTPAIANGKGVFIVPDDKQAAQLLDDIRKFDGDMKEGDIKTSLSIPTGKEKSALARHKYVIIKKTDVERFLPHLKDSLIAIDEAQEVDPRVLKTLLAGTDRNKVINVNGRLRGSGNTVIPVTATWTDELQAIFGDPLTEIDMHYALNTLKAFRPIHTNKVQFTPNQSTDDRVFDMLLDYYGSKTYKQEGDKDHLALKPQAVGDTPPSHRIIREIMQANEVNRSGTINMAFTKNPELLQGLTDAYQAVFEGSYPRLEELAQKVSEKRALHQNREARRVVDEIMGKNEPAKHVTIQLKNDAAASCAVSAHDLQKEAQDALKQQIADVTTRKIVGIFADNTSPSIVRSIQKKGQLDNFLKLYSGSPERLDTHQKGFISRIKERGEGSPYEAIGKTLDGIANKEEILKAIEQGDYTKLHVKKEAIDLARFPQARYATLVKPGDEAGAADTAQRINRGLHIHIIGDSELATGYSNPDILSVQRVIENLIPEGVIRGTQMLGRAIRAKDGRAFASEYLGPDLNPEGIIGAKNGRPFLFEDVLSSEYSARAKTYSANFAKDHPEQRPALPPDEIEILFVDPANSQAASTKKSNRLK